MLIDLHTVRPGRTLRIPFSTFDKDDGSTITMTNYAVGDILIYKDGSTTERASTAGFTATTDFDSKTGKHLLIIDLADNTTAGFFAAGSEYLVGIDAVTVDGVTVGGWVARFVIGYQGAIIDTTIATVNSQTSIVLTVGPAEADALKGCYAIIHDQASAVQLSRVLITAYGTSLAVTLGAAPTFTIAAGDNISIFAPPPQVSDALSGDITNGGLARASDVIGAIPIRTGTAQAGTSSSITLDASASSVTDFYARTWVRITSGTGVGQTRLITSYNGTTKVANTTAWATTPDNTSVFAILPQAGVDTRMWLGTAPNALSSGRVDATVGAITAGVIAAASFAADYWTTLLSTITGSTLFTGITSLAQWLGLIAGKQVGNTTARTELRATGAGSGSFDETTDSLEANRDNIGTAGANLTAADDAVITAIAAVPTAAANAAAVEAAILNEGDATALLAAIAAKVETFLINEGDATATMAAIATAVRTNLATELARIDAAISTRATPAQVAAELATYDGPTHAEMTAELAAADDATLAAIALISKLLRADRKIDKTTNPAHWDEVLLEEGTATELVRRELFDPDGPPRR